MRLLDCNVKEYWSDIVANDGTLLKYLINMLMIG